MGKKLFGGLITGLVVIYLLGLIIHISTNYDKYQWDFRTHRQAGKIFASGSNPYDPDILFPKARTRLLYTYPPVSLFFYRLFSLTDYKTAFHIFLFLKCILLIGLIYLWKREFLKKDADGLFYLFCLFAFNGAVFLDIRAGNINLVEQVMLWLAFSFYLKRRLLPFCFFTLIAASFKMIPIFFMLLLLLSEDKKKYIYFFGSALAFSAYLLIQYLLVPHLFTGFVRNASAVMGERGIIVPSTFTLIRDIFIKLNENTGVTVPPPVRIAIFCIIAAATILLTRKAYVLLKQINIEDKEKIELFLLCLFYGLIHPRFKDYAYMLLLVPSYYMLKNARSIKAFPFIFVLCVLSSRHLTLPGTPIVFSFFWEYYPLMIAYCVWGIYLYEIFALAKKPISVISHGSE